MGGEQDVLSGRGAVAGPHGADLARGRVATDDDRQRRFLQHHRVRLYRCDRVESRPVFDDDKLPRLLVSCRRGSHGALQQLLHLLLAHGLRMIPADAPPRQNRFNSVHI